MLKRLIMIGLMFGGLWACSWGNALAGQEVELQTTSAACIRKIYDQLITKREAGSVLSDLKETALKADELGWPYLEYSHDLADGQKFYLLVRALPRLAVDSHKKFEEYREFADSFVDVKFIVYVNNISLLGDLNVYAMAQEVVASLHPTGSRENSLRLYIVPERKVFKLKEKVAFDLLLRNEGSVGLRLKKMDERSVSCYFNGALWGKDEAAPGEKPVVLEPGQVLRKKFHLRAQRPGELEIRCIYGLKIKGDQPSATASVNIE